MRNGLCDMAIGLLIILSLAAKPGRLTTSWERLLTATLAQVPKLDKGAWREPGLDNKLARADMDMQVATPATTIIMVIT